MILYNLNIIKDMKKLIPILLAVFALASCEKDPDMGKLDDNYLVYTNYDKKADFKVPTFYLAPQILVISDSKEPEYLEGEGAEQILAAYTDNMIARGYAAATNKVQILVSKWATSQVLIISPATHNLNGGGVIPDTGDLATGVATGVVDGTTRTL